MCAFALFSSNNTFGFYYHPDEASKARQLSNNTRNFRHPQLLLTTTELVKRIVSQRNELSLQRITELGRMVSAFFAACTVALLSLLAGEITTIYSKSEWTVFATSWSVGLACLANPLLFEIAHFLKEDTSFVFGLAMFFWALHRLNIGSDNGTLLGASVAVAASGKYVGWLTLPLALFILQKPFNAPKQFFAKFFLSLLTVWGVINYRVLSKPFATFTSLQKEAEVISTTNQGFEQQLSASYYFEMIGRIPAFILILAIFTLVFFLINRRKTSLSEWTILIFTLFYFTLIACSPRSVNRYFIPVSLFIYSCAGVGTVLLSSLVASKCAKQSNPVFLCTWAIGLVLLLLSEKPQLTELYHGFASNTHDRLRHWLQDHVPAEGVIAADGQVRLPKDDWRHAGEPLFRQRVLDATVLGDLGTLEELCRRGVTHLVVQRVPYSNFRSGKPLEEQYLPLYLKRRAFYAHLGLVPGTQRHPAIQLVWASRPAEPELLNPLIRVYDIRGLTFP